MPICGTLTLYPVLHASLRKRIDSSRVAQEQIRNFSVIDIGYYPKESNLITFRDPYSFPILFHPGCNHLVRQHLSDLAQKIVSVCVSLGEYPVIRYWRPATASHEAAVLCTHLAKFVQDEIDMYATYHRDFPPPSNRPRGALYILDRSLDLMAPVIHEFTYQAMVHDLLPVRDREKVTYRMKINEGEPNQTEKDVEITDKDRIWVANRHTHMKDTIEKLMGDFQRFLDQNPHFTRSAPDGATSLGAIKDMMAGLPEFQEMKESYSLHLTMAQEAMNQFQARSLPELASVEQSLATGLDEDHKRPKGMADQVVRTLDADGVEPADRLRLIMLFLLFRDGIVPADLTKLLAHAQLPPQDGDAVRNLGMLGARVQRAIKEKSQFAPVFPPKPPAVDPQQEYSLSRFQPNLKRLLEEHSRNSLDQNLFPHTKPQLDPAEGVDNTPATSLRSAKPTWARTRAVNNEPRQRVMVFMAGGATYSEARACYETGNEAPKDVYLMTSHMLSPGLFIRQLGDLSVDRRRLDIPMERAKKQAPAHLFEAEAPPQAAVATPPAPSPHPPTAQMGGMGLGNGQANGGGRVYEPPPPVSTAPASLLPPEPEKKKKKGLFSRSKK